MTQIFAAIVFPHASQQGVPRRSCGTSDTDRNRLANEN
jgi:hypothetical protein